MTISPDDILIFLGPSLPVEEAKSILDARYLPPAKQGDILSVAVQFQPKVIGLIDGTFMQTLSVWHKEILYAIDQGIIVLGASSMGALRAAETADFGMIGVGKVFELYHNGTVIDDDEVVLIHGPKEEGYIPLSLPLINIRFTLERAKNEQRIPADVCEAFFALAQELYYPERTIENIIECARKKGFSEELIGDVTGWMQAHYVDQKADDARLLLQKIKALSLSETVEKKEFSRTSLFEVLFHADRRLSFSEVELTQRQIAQHFALHDPHFPEMQFNAMNQAMANALSKIYKVEVSVEEIKEEKKRFRRRHLLQEDWMWTSWLVRNHLTEKEFSSLAEEKAKTRKLHACFSSGQFPWKQGKFLLNELKWADRYEEGLEKAVAQEEILNEIARYYNETDSSEIYQAKFIDAHKEATGWNPDMPLKEWAEEAGFEDLLKLVTEIHKSKIARDHLNKIVEAGLDEASQ